MKLFSKSLISLAVAGIGLVSMPAFAGGLYLYELGTDDLGLAGAGMAVRAEDASVLAANPAGLTHVKGKSFTSGFQALYGDTDFDLDNSSLNGPGNTIGFTPIVSAFYSQQLNEDLTFGLGLYANFGLGLDFDTWAASALLNKIELTGVVLQPTLAYKASDTISLGIGFGFNYGRLKLDNTVFEDEAKDHDWAYNTKVGIMYEKNENTRFGFSYTTEADFDFDPKLEIADTDFLLDATFNAPQQAMFSGYHRFNQDWAIMGNLGWQNWEEYGNSDIQDGTLTPAGQLEDTYHVAFGAQYTVSPRMIWNMGMAYDTSMFDDQDDGLVTVPTGQAFRVGTGLKYALTNTQSLGVAFEGTFIESSRAAIGPISGKYDNPALYFLMVNYSWKSE